MDLARRIRTEREARQMSQEALARQAGMSLRALNSLERGEAVNPHYATLVGIADALGMPISNLLEELGPLSLDDPRVEELLRERGYVSDEEFLDYVGEMPLDTDNEDRSRAVNRTINELGETFERIDSTLRKPSTRKALIPLPPGLQKDEGIEKEKERIAQIRQLRRELRRVYYRRWVALLNYRAALRDPDYLALEEDERQRMWENEFAEAASV